MTDTAAPQPESGGRCVSVILQRWRDSAGRTPPGVLSAQEIQRWNRLIRPDDRARFAAGRVLLRELLRQQVDMDPADVTLDAVCPRGHRSHGPLRVVGCTDVSVSISHAGPWVAAVVSRHGAVGIDVEPGHDLGDLTPPLMRRVFTSAEQAIFDRSVEDDQMRIFASSWVRKEAVAKATGRGVDLGLAHIDVRNPVVVVPAERLAGSPAERSFRWVDLRDRSDCLAAVALQGAGSFRIDEASP